MSFGFLPFFYVGVFLYFIVLAIAELTGSQIPQEFEKISILLLQSLVTALLYIIFNTIVVALVVENAADDVIIINSIPTAMALLMYVIGFWIYPDWWSRWEYN